MKPNGHVDVTLRLSTSERGTTNEPTIWDLAAALNALHIGPCHTSEVIAYDPKLRVGHYLTNDGEAELDQESVGLSKTSDFTLTIDAQDLRSALQLRRQILDGSIAPITRPVTPHERNAHPII